MIDNKEIVVELETGMLLLHKVSRRGFSVFPITIDVHGTKSKIIAQRPLEISNARPSRDWNETSKDMLICLSAWKRLYAS